MSLSGPQNSPFWEKLLELGIVNELTRRGNCKIFTSLSGNIEDPDETSEIFPPAKGFQFHT